MDLSKIKVKQWSFCRECDGTYRGCSKCKHGVVVKEIALDAISKGAIRESYVRAQQEFIKKQIGEDGWKELLGVVGHGYQKASTEAGVTKG